ncbi:MAG: TAXI family TRAP transporter solute-binding subunit [Armatimonadetes bacterium]|nr:TAXI family TRAP transporter solute-binding subunit [Armatimonadota bacterium]
MRLRDVLKVILCLLMVTFLICGCQAKTEPSGEKGGASQTPAKTTQLKIAAGGMGSALYLAGGAMEEYLRGKANIPNLMATAQTTGGFVENLRLVEKGEADLGITGTSTLYQSLHSSGPFKEEKACQNIQALFPIWVGATHWVTYRADLRTLGDLKGKHVNVGPAGSATITNAEITLRAAGIWDNVKKDSQDWSEGVRLLQDGIIDALTSSGPVPFPAVQEAATVVGRKLRFIELGEDVCNNVLKSHPELMKVVVPKNSYGEGIPERDYETCGYVAYVVANKNVPEEVVYEVMNALLSDSGQKFLVDSVNGIKSGFEKLPGFEPLEPVGIKMHPGAVRYWKEKGVNVPSALVP